MESASNVLGYAVLFIGIALSLLLYFLIRGFWISCHAIHPGDTRLEKEEEGIVEYIAAIGNIGAMCTICFPQRKDKIAISPSVQIQAGQRASVYYERIYRPWFLLPIGPRYYWHAVKVIAVR